MDIFEQGLVNKVRFIHSSVNGEMNLEDIQGLKVEILNQIAVQIDDEILAMPRKSYLTNDSSQDKATALLHLRRALVIHTLERKQSEAKDKAQAAAKARKAREDKEVAAAVRQNKLVEAFKDKTMEELDAILES